MSIAATVRLGTSSSIQNLVLLGMNPAPVGAMAGYITLGLGEPIRRQILLGLETSATAPNTGYVLLGTADDVNRLLLLGMAPNAVSNIPGTGAGSLRFTPSGAGAKNIYDVPDGYDVVSMTFTVSGEGAIHTHGGGGDVALNFTPVALGTVDHFGSGSVSMEFVAQGEAATAVAGSGAASLGFNVSGTGRRDLRSVTAAASLVLQGSGVGLPKTVGPFGSGDIALTFVPSASAELKIPTTGTGSASMTFTCSGEGRLDHNTSSDVQFGFVASGQGRIEHYGSGAPQIKFFATNELMHPFVHRRRRF